jgi:2-iminobutanoate/2-iminopropanoate deaminase
MEILIAEKVSPAYGPFCHAIKANGFLFCSGITPVNAEGIVEDETVAGQTRQVSKNIKAILGYADVNINQVVKTTIYLKDLSNYETVNKIYADFFGSHRPARTCIEVSRLPKESLVEMECIAVLI